MTSDDDDFVAKEAKRREALHAASGDYRAPVGNITGYQANLKGLRGEQAFSQEFGLPLRCLDGPGGDGGYEFIVPLMTPRGVQNICVDVKTAEIPKWLVSWAKKTKPLVLYILARYSPIEDRATLLGWEWGIKLMTSQPRPPWLANGSLAAAPYSPQSRRNPGKVQGRKMTART